MNENVKDSSDSVEKKEVSLLTLERTIEALKTDNNLLKEKINEQNLLINEKLKSFINDLQDIEEIKVLKEMIVSQRQEIYQKENKIKHLEANMINLTEEIKKYEVIEKQLKDTTLLKDAHQANNKILAEKTDLENQLVNLSNKYINLEKQNEILLKNLEKAKVNQENISKLEKTISQLNTRISELKKENMTLREKNGISKEDQEYILKLEAKIVEYDETISNLEEIGKSNSEIVEKLKTDYSNKIAEINLNIENAQKTIAQLGEDNKNLREIVKLSKNEQLTTSEQKISGIRRIITNLGKNNREIEGKNEVLKPVLLHHVASETKDTEVFSKGVKTMQIPKFPEKISEISDEVVQEKVQRKSDIQSIESRRFCPKCGNRNIRLIHEIEDKTKIISTYPRMYGKKNKCGQCGFEWH